MGFRIIVRPGRLADNKIGSLTEVTWLENCLCGRVSRQIVEIERKRVGGDW